MKGKGKKEKKLECQKVASVVAQRPALFTHPQLVRELNHSVLFRDERSR